MSPLEFSLRQAVELYFPEIIIGKTTYVLQQVTRSETIPSILFTYYTTDFEEYVAIGIPDAYMHYPYEDLMKEYEKEWKKHHRPVKDTPLYKALHGEM